MDDDSSNATATDRLCSRKAIAEYAQVHPSQVPSLIARGMPVTMISNEYRSRKALIDRWFDEQALEQVGVRHG